MAGVGTLRCIRELGLFPITRAAGGEGTGAWGREPGASPESHTERGLC